MPIIPKRVVARVIISRGRSATGCRSHVASPDGTVRGVVKSGGSTMGLALGSVFVVRARTWRMMTSAGGGAWIGRCEHL